MRGRWNDFLRWARLGSGFRPADSWCIGDRSVLCMPLSSLTIRFSRGPDAEAFRAVLRNRGPSGPRVWWL